MDKKDSSKQNHSNQNLIEQINVEKEPDNNLDYEGDFIETAETRILRFLKNCFNIRVHISNGIFEI